MHSAENSRPDDDDDDNQMVLEVPRAEFCREAAHSFTHAAKSWRMNVMQKDLG